jgi:hypothetical protein
MVEVSYQRSAFSVQRSAFSFQLSAVSRGTLLSSLIADR